MVAPSLLNLFSPVNIMVFMLVLTRISGLMTSAPFFSTIAMPISLKVWFSATIAFIMFPIVLASKNYLIPHDMPEFLILLALEFFIGYLIGFLANFVIEGVRMCGSVLAIQMGLSISEALDPATGVSSNELSKIYVYLTLLIFLSTGAYQMLFIILQQSFNSVPMGAVTLFNSSVVQGITVMFGQLFKIAFGLALPIFAVLLVSDVLLGLMNKMMPQMNIYMVALPVKMYIGFILIFAFLTGSAVYITSMIKGYFNAIGGLFGI